MITCSHRLEVLAVPGLPLVAPGDDVPALVAGALSAAALSLTDGDVLVVTSKILSRAEGRFVELPRVEPSARAIELAREVRKDPRAVELILRESTAISRQAPGVLVVRHRLGFVVANAGIDLSNAVPADASPGRPVGAAPARGAGRFGRGHPGEGRGRVGSERGGRHQ